MKPLHPPSTRSFLHHPASRTLAAGCALLGFFAHPVSAGIDAEPPKKTVPLDWAEIGDKVAGAISNFAGAQDSADEATAKLLLGGLGAFEGWRGDFVWEKYRAEAESRGVKLWPRDLVPAPIPDDQNFVAVPFIQKCFAAGAEKNPPRDDLPDLRQAPFYLKNSFTGVRGNVLEIRDALATSGQLSSLSENPARDVLTALEKYAPGHQQLRDAAHRPGYYYPLEWEKGYRMPKPHLGSLNSVSQTLHYSVVAQLALGDRPAALRDWLLLFRLHESVDGQGDVVMSMLFVLHGRELLSTVWEGFAGHQWSEKELATIEQKLGTLNYLARCRRTLAIERALLNGELQRLFQLTPEEFSREVTAMSSPPGDPALFTAYPRGWIRQNMVLANRYHDAFLAPLQLREGREPTTVAALEKNAAWLRREAGDSTLAKLQYFLAYLLLPELDHFVDQHLANEMNVRQARLACALERHYLKHRSYPETLDALVPAYLPAIPIDIFDGQPMRYRPSKDGGYTLWSIGADRKDDQGQALSDDAEKKPLDGVWKIPGK